MTLPTNDAAPATALQEHVQECAACADEHLPIGQVEALLGGPATPFDPASLSGRVLVQARPILRKQAQVRWRRQVLAAVLVASLPLPAVLVLNACLLLLLHAGISALVSTGVATYVVLTYGASVALLFALTYAAIPIWMANAGPRHPAAG